MQTSKQQTSLFTGDGINILTGGFPCQPFSTAGKRRGKDDDRFLWPEMLRAIREIQPTWIVGENVAGIQDMALTEILSDLENEGYKPQTFLIPAYGLGGVHRRERIWIVAHSSCWDAQNGYTKYGISQTEIPIKFSTNAYGHFNIPGWGELQNESRVCGINVRIPKKVNRLKSLGNAICPPIAFQIFKAIEECEP